MVMMSDKNYYFQKLTPINNVELRIYEDALDFVFANDNINNVAVSGSYSAGKSSVIETYKSTHSNLRFLHISLAHFESTGLGKKSETDKGAETFLEGKILNQLIHQIDPEEIPQTHFKVKQKVSNEKIGEIAAIITAFLILSVYIGCFKDWSQFVSTLPVAWLKSALLWTTNSSMLLLSGIICTFILGTVVYTLIKTQKNKGIFRRVSIQGNEIEIFEEHEDSYFDKYLNEVLYLFENSKADVIVFEDMDRFNVNRIFEKLREINTLVNNKKKIEKSPEIKFFYLLRDDIFTSKDRTKFFDFIIPIVPVVDGSNSYDQFIAHFKQGGILELFDEKFLQGLSLYIDDMRVLKNIYNEFVIYFNRIESTELDRDKLLAIIAYKNIFPRDFGNLQIGMGFVHTLFESKHDFIKEEISRIEMEIRLIEDEIEFANSEMLVSVDELDAAFLLSNLQIHAVAGNNISTFKTRAQLVKAMKDNPKRVQYYAPNYNPSVQQKDMTSDFQQLLQNTEYINRKQGIERNTGTYVEQLKEDIQKLQLQKSIVLTSRLRDIIKNETVFGLNFKNEIGEENTFAEIKSSSYFALIKYLVRNGFIDETYPDYMTYFYENSLSRIDKIFLRSVTDEKPKEYSYPLKDSKMVLSRLRVVDFDHVEILNFDLLCYLLKTKPINDLYLSGLLHQLMKTKNYIFIGEFLGLQRETDSFVEALNNVWPSVFQCILAESGFSDAQKRKYAIDTLYYSSDADIEALNENDCLSTFISESPIFLDIATPNITKIVDGFSLIGVRFTWINHEVSNKDLFLAVYKNNLYQLRFDLISLIFKVVYGYSESSDFNSKSYTLVTSKQEEPLVQYVNENIDQYIGIILDNCSEGIDDEEPVVLEILNNSEIDNDHKKEYINFLQTVIERIESVLDKGLWSLLLQKKLVYYSENNVLNYFFHSENGLDSFLIQFINDFDHKPEFDENTIDSNFGEESTSKFFNAIAACNELNNERYEVFLQALSMNFSSFSKTGIAEDKVQILIKLYIIRMADPVLIFMREHYPNQLMLFVTHNIDQYTEGINTENFVLNEMLLVLEENVDDEYKVKLLKFTPDKLSLKQKGYSDAVKLHILNHNLDVSDIPFLLSSYPGESVGVKASIESISIEHIGDIVTMQHSTPFELLLELLASSQIAKEVQKELFALGLPGMNEVQAKECLLILQMHEFLSLFNRSRPRFEVNVINERILNIFKEKRWITTFDLVKDVPDYFRAYGRKVG